MKRVAWFRPVQSNIAFESALEGLPSLRVLICPVSRRPPHQRRSVRRAWCDRRRSCVRRRSPSRRSARFGEVRSLRRAFIPVCHGIIDPAIDCGFSPACAMNADLYLGGERPFGDLAIHGRAGQAGPGENGLQADDLVGVGHGTCFHSLAFIGCP